MVERKFYLLCKQMIKGIRAICSVLMLFMLLVVVFQVFARGIFSLPTPWTEEVAIILVTYNTFIGGIAVMMKGEHLAIDLVSERVSKNVRSFFQILYILVFLGVCTYLVIYGTELCMDPIIYKQKTLATGFPRVALYGVMPACMGICDIYCIFHLFYIVRHIIRGEEPTGVNNVDTYAAGA